MATLFWYELLKRYPTHVALDRPRTAGELVNLNDAIGYVINTTDQKWSAYNGRGQLIGKGDNVREAKALVDTYATAKRSSVFIDLFGESK